MAQHKSYLKKRNQVNSPKKKSKKQKGKSEVVLEKKPSVFLVWLNKIGNAWHYWSLIPILMMISVIPLIVYAKLVELTPLEEQNWLGGTYDFDFFSYYKSVWIVALTVILVLFFILLILVKKIQIKKATFMIPLGLHLLLSILSTVFALDSTVAQRGFMEMFQGIYVLLSYGLITWITFHLVQKENQIRLIIGAFIFLGVVIGILGFYQYIGRDPLRTDFGLQLILPKVMEPIASELTFIFDKYDIYATLGNTNFVGSYAALMIPLAFVLYLYSKKIIFMMFNLTFLGLMLLVGFGSNSRAGMIGIIVSLLMVIIIFRKMFISRPIKILLPFILMAGVGYVLNVETDGKVINEINTINIFKAIEEAKQYADSKVFITRIEIEDDKLYIETEEEGIILEWKNNGLWPYSLDGELLAVTISNRNVSFVDETYKNFRIRIFEDQNAFTITTYGRSFNLYYTPDGLRVLSNGGTLDIPVMPEKVELLDQYGILFSGRAFIWSRSIPLLKDYFWIGSGPDHYPIVYPQTDIAGKLNYMGLYTIVDKPHNMYIQMGINTGVISLIAFLALIMVYIVQSIKKYIKRFELSYMNAIGSACFLSVIAYLAAGFFNDQRVSVAPLFYIILGLGFAINQFNEKQDADNSLKF